MRSFVHNTHPARIVFGCGTHTQIRDEVQRLGCTRTLVLGGPPVGDLADHVQKGLGPLAVARFDGAAAHTPTAVTQRALDLVRAHSVDGVVAVGGGSTTGLAKAIAARTDLPQVILPTTYAGSEVTPALDETAHGRTTSRSGPEILPETVIYDVEFTLALPVSLSVTSGVTAIAHAVEALYSRQANPVVDAWALDAITRMAGALPRIAADPADLHARAEALRATWLAGNCLGHVDMGLQHHLCRVLDSSFDLPHAATHTVLLPHTMAYNAPAAVKVMRRVAGALGAGDAPAATFDLITSLHGPTTLHELGVTESDLSTAAGRATSSTPPNPRDITTDAVTTVLDEAWSGRRPATMPSQRASAGSVSHSAMSPLR